MIARVWRASATPANADAYSRHFAGKVVPHLKSIAGHHHAYLLRRPEDGQVELLAVTFWDSIDTVKNFAGNNPEIAIVDPEARAMLSEFDDFARNFEVAYRD
jgi:heme-degrading monooxygenase HmoA